MGKYIECEGDGERGRDREGRETRKESKRKREWEMARETGEGGMEERSDRGSEGVRGQVRGRSG